MADVKAWPKATGTPMPAPKRIRRPCDYGLMAAVNNAETQLGTIEAYNRLVEHADELRARIERGDVKPQNPLFALDIKGDPKRPNARLSRGPEGDFGLKR